MFDALVGSRTFSVTDGVLERLGAAVLRADAVSSVRAEAVTLHGR